MDILCVLILISIACVALCMMVNEAANDWLGREYYDSMILYIILGLFVIFCIKVGPKLIDVFSVLWN